MYQLAGSIERKSDIVYYDKSVSQGFRLDIKSPFFVTHKIYFCLKTDYTNRDGTLQKPLIKIFNITNELDQRFLPIYDITYDKILGFLTSRKYF